MAKEPARSGWFRGSLPVAGSGVLRVCWQE